MTDIEERLLAHSGSEHGGWIMKDAAAEIARLRALFRIAAGQVERLAFDIPAPNNYTPQFVMLANDMRAALGPKS